MSALSLEEMFQEEVLELATSNDDLLAQARQNIYDAVCKDLTSTPLAEEPQYLNWNLSYEENIAILQALRDLRDNKTDK